MSRHHAAAILGPSGPLASIRVRVAHTRASDTAVTNDIVEPAYSRWPAISSSRGDGHGASIAGPNAAAGLVRPATILDRSANG